MLLVGVAHAQPQFKQLAGPPAEMPAMASADPSSSATRSRSALLPVALEQTGPGQWTWRSEIPVEGATLRLLVFPGGSGTNPNPWRVTLRDPANANARPDAVAVERRAVPLGLSGRDIPANYLQLDNLPPGNRSIAIESDAPGRGFVLVQGAGPARLLSHQTAFNQRVGQHIGLVARIYDQDTGAQAKGGSVSAGLLRVTTPDGAILTSAMYDDGLHQDGEAGDGIYGGEFLADRPGAFTAQVVFTGQDRSGNGFVRTAQHLIPVVEEQLNLRGDTATGEMVDPQRLAIRIGVSASKPSDHYRVVAEVWGSAASGSGEPVPVAWIAGMSAIRGDALALGLDTRWIAKSGAQGPFELRNLRIEDPDYFITLASVERMALSMPGLPGTEARLEPIVVDEQMRMGPRPHAAAPPGGAAAQSLAYTSGTGHKLLLVHGYCSSDVWGPNVGQFPHAGADSVFLDLGQNRSHDAFAQLILDFGLQWNSYAIVAHSQGGAAALQLYTHYWSGLDNAGPGRLIQSVGTPYQGTPLASDLALLGQLFGQGCGTNYDMTYSGAATWLAGIPPSFRAAVNYYTTSFEDRPFQYDYCNLVTDLFLTDPDDGVTEQAAGQLPDGVNQGHTPGQCHTTGMRDPARVQRRRPKRPHGRKRGRRAGARAADASGRGVGQGARRGGRFQPASVTAAGDPDHGAAERRRRWRTHGRPYLRQDRHQRDRHRHRGFRDRRRADLRRRGDDRASHRRRQCAVRAGGRQRRRFGRRQHRRERVGADRFPPGGREREPERHPDRPAAGECGADAARRSRELPARREPDRLALLSDLLVVNSHLAQALPPP